MVWARGNCGDEDQGERHPVFAFEFIGLDTGATDTAILVPTSFGTYKTPLAANKANTPTFSFFGVATLALESFELELRQQERAGHAHRLRAGAAHGPQERRLDHDRDDLGRDEGLDVAGEERDARCAEPRTRRRWPARS
jgi:hypothetical protein